MIIKFITYFIYFSIPNILFITRIALFSISLSCCPNRNCLTSVTKSPQGSKILLKKDSASSLLLEELLSLQLYVDLDKDNSYSSNRLNKIETDSGVNDNRSLVQFTGFYNYSYYVIYIYINILQFMNVRI